MQQATYKFGSQDMLTLAILLMKWVVSGQQQPMRQSLTTNNRILRTHTTMQQHIYVAQLIIVN